MKKFLIGACAAAMVMLASCSGDKTSTVVPRALSDSISSAYGTASGSFSLADVVNYNAGRENPVSKEDVLKGIRIALAQGENQGVLIGMQIGSGMNNEMRHFAEQGIDINRSEVFNAFKKSFMADTIDMEQMRENHNAANELMRRAMQMIEEAQNAKAAEEPNAVQNGLAAKAYVDNLKEQDADIKTTKSGLSYKIIEQGDDTPITAESKVGVIYTGRHIDGTVFDSSNGQPVPFGVNQVVPGFAEGLQLLGNGGKATLYIPGELAYGPNGQPQAGIGPNEMLVFDIEIAEVQ